MCVLIPVIAILIPVVPLRKLDNRGSSLHFPSHSLSPIAAGALICISQCCAVTQIRALAQEPLGIDDPLEEPIQRCNPLLSPLTYYTPHSIQALTDHPLAH